MTTFIIRRLLASIPVIFGVSIIVFMLIHMIPGDPAIAMLGERASDENIEAMRERLGLNEPLHEQYLIWMGNMIQGDLGNTVRGNMPIASELKNRFPATIELSVVALIIATTLGVPIGIVSAVKRNSIFDTGSMMVALFGVSIPIFVLGLVLIYIFGIGFGVSFVGRIEPTMPLDRVTGFLLIDSLLAGNWKAFGDAVEHLILPSFTLMTISMAVTARITRSAMLEVLNQDYIRTARAKGLNERSVIMKHALGNALLPVVTIIGLQMGTLLSGAVLTETIFSWPGIGKWLYDSIIARDYPIVQSVTLLIAIVYIMVNLLVDVLYTFIDPRVRSE